MTTEEIIRMLRRDGYHDAADRMEQPVEQLAEARWERDVAALRGMEGGQ